MTMTRLVCVVLALLMLFASAAYAGDTSNGEELLTQYNDCSTISRLFEAAEAALDAGAEPKLVYDTMYSLAESKDMIPYFQYALENAASYDSDRYQSLLSAVQAESGKQELSLSLSVQPGRGEVNKIGFNAYDHYQLSDAFLSMVSDPNAEFCLGRYFWTDKMFESYYGKPFAKFVPTRPRAGYVCVVIKNDSKTNPEKSWNVESNSNFISTLNTTVSDLLETIYNSSPESVPVITANPNLASYFWVFQMDYPFYSWYGTRSNPRQVRAFNCVVSLSVLKAKTHKAISSVNKRNNLPNRISWWNDDNTAQADIPVLSEQGNYASFARTVVNVIQKDDSSAVSLRPITAINADTVLNGVLLDQAVNNTSDWQIAIYESGAQNVSLGEDNTISFSLRGYNPKVKELGAYADASDGSQWLRDALNNASAYNLDLTLPLENSQLSTAAIKTLSTTVQKAATTAQQGFSSKDMVAALKDRFFPSAFAGKIKESSDLQALSDGFAGLYAASGAEGAGVSEEHLALIAYAQKSVGFDVKAGPHAVTVNCVGTEPSALLSGSAEAALDELAYAPAESRTSLDRLEELLTGKLREAALKSHSTGKAKFTLTFDVDELLTGNPESYTSSLSGFAYSSEYESLHAKAEKLPEAAAQALPKNGKLSGENKGTQVVFKLSNTSEPTYVQMRSASTDAVAVSLFVLPGKQVNVRVPEGSYRLLYCSGPYWYGEEALFGDLGSYSRSDETEILGKQYTHTFTLETVDNGEIPVHTASPDDFR